jgi:acetyl esterase/lipase
MNHASGSAPTLQELAWALRIGAHYNVMANIVYGQVDGVDLKLDVYRAWTVERPKPTVMFMHGGGWMAGATKETWALWFLPFLQLGWTVVNVDYRPSSLAHAPAAVADCLEALGWICSNAETCGFDLEQLVIAGLSAGGHLALTTGMIPHAARGASGLPEDLVAFARHLVPKAAARQRPAAIINWCGVTDVADVADGPNRQDYVAEWVGRGPDHLAVARQVSPVAYVTAGLAPIITIHGNADDHVPYRQAVRLHDALSAARVRNELITLPGAVHGALAEHLDTYPRVFAFLAQAGLQQRLV